MANRWGTSTCALRKSPPPVRTLAWLGLASSKHSHSTTQAGTSRRKKLRLTARPQCLVDRALHCSAEHASQQHSVPQLHQSQPLQSTVDLRPVSHTPSSTMSFAAITTAESPVADTKTKHSILATAL